MGSKIAFLLFMFFAIPIVIMAPQILGLWLGNIPEYTVIFVRLALVDALINSLGGPLTTGAMATGKIKKLSIWIGVFRFAVFPLSYIVFTIIPVPYLSYCALIVCDIILVAVRLIISYNQLGLKTVKYFTNVIARVVATATICFVISFCYSKFLSGSGLSSLIMFTILSCITTLIVSSLVALNNIERKKIITLVKSKILL